jgi:hypothetical protein
MCEICGGTKKISLDVRKAIPLANGDQAWLGFTGERREYTCPECGASKGVYDIADEIIESCRGTDDEGGVEFSEHNGLRDKIAAALQAERTTVGGRNAD